MAYQLPPVKQNKDVIPGHPFQARTLLEFDCDQKILASLQVLSAHSLRRCDQWLPSPYPPLSLLRLINTGELMGAPQGLHRPTMLSQYVSSFRRIMGLLNLFLSLFLHHRCLCHLQLSNKNSFQKFLESMTTRSNLRLLFPSWGMSQGIQDSFSESFTQWLWLVL